MPRRLFPPAARDLVMGLATGYSVEKISPFIESLFTDGAFAGELVLFIAAGDPQLDAYLESWGATCVHFQPERYPTSNIILSRWFAYHNYLQERVDRAGDCFLAIMICDVRDVIFQSPLFALPCEMLEFHAEADQPRIGACSYNSSWMSACFGEEALARLAGQRILCAGTMCGRLRGVLDYLDVMTRLALDLSEEGKQQFGADQAALNYIAYNGLVREATIRDNFERVATLHYVEAATLCADPCGRVVNPDGSISEMAHQWDRHPQLAAPIMSQATRRRRQTSNPIPRALLRLYNRLRRGFGGW